MDMGMGVHERIEIGIGRSGQKGPFRMVIDFDSVDEKCEVMITHTQIGLACHAPRCEPDSLT